jgi:hypothetical protein
MKGPHGLDRKARKGQPEPDRQNKIAMTGIQDSAARIVLTALDCKEKTVRAEQKREDSQKRAGMQGS